MKLSLVILFIALITGCGQQSHTAQVDRVVSESEIEFENGRRFQREYFIIARPPAEAGALRRLIDDTVQSLGAGAGAEDFDLHVTFYRSKWGLDASFEPFVSDWCFLGCEPIHIYEAGYDQRLAEVSVSQDRCQLFRYYLFYKRSVFGKWHETVTSDRQILDPEACRVKYGYEFSPSPG